MRYSCFRNYLTRFCTVANPVGCVGLPVSLLWLHLGFDVTKS